MLAAVLEAFGLNLGEYDPYIYEDFEIGYAIRYFFDDIRAQIIEKRNAAFPRWGFKFPTLQNHLFPPEIHKFRNPRLVVMSRDIAAVANRINLSEKDMGLSDTWAALKEANRQETDLLRFLELGECPTAFFSYEKFLAFPSECVNILAAFTGIKITPEQQIKAVKRVVANNPGYIGTFHG